MKVLVVGECAAENVYRLEDPRVPSEDEFGSWVVKALRCVYPDYRCISFNGTFAYDGQRSQPDLALVAKDLTHWFIVEVELVTHSLEGHVLPQLRALRYGEPCADCIDAMARELSIPAGQAETLIRLIPRSVVLVANEPKADWEKACLGLDAQMLTVSVYSGAERTAFEVGGQIRVVRESLGFGTYSATDKAVQLPASIQIASGEVAIDVDGFQVNWLARRSGETLWLTRLVGEPDFPDRAYLQVIRTFGNRLALRLA